MGQLLDFFLPNRIFFNKELSGKIEKVYKTYKEAFVKFQQNDWLRDMGVQQTYDKVIETFEKANSLVYRDSQVIKSEIEDEFQKILLID